MKHRVVAYARREAGDCGKARRRGERWINARQRLRPGSVRVLGKYRVSSGSGMHFCNYKCIVSGMVSNRVQPHALQPTIRK